MTLPHKTSLLAIVTAMMLIATLGPAPRPAEASTYASVDAGGEHTCAVTTANGVQCWGSNEYGQLGDGTTVNRLSPLSVPGLTNATALIAGGWHSCAVLKDASMKCWGRNEFGQLGDGTTANRSSPTAVCASGSGGSCVPLANVSVVSGGHFHTCAVTTPGGAKCWGQNFSGQLGNGTTTGSVNPVDVTGLTANVAGVAGGRIHTCALTTGGGVKCWGDNSSGQLGNGTFTSSLTAVAVSGLASGVAAIGAGDSHTCALMSSGGGVKCWGDNTGGQLGDGTTILAANVPTDVCAAGSAPSCTPLTGVAAVSPGDAHTCALAIAGGVKCWGWDGFGQLGDGAPSFFEFGVNPQNVPGLTGAGSDPDVAKVNAGSGHTCALTIAGVLKCWGWNLEGQIGNGTTTDVSSVVTADFDRDGCQDERELGLNATLGGLRDPKSFWDFFDTPDASNVRDRLIVQADIDRVGARFGANDNNGTAPINRYTDPFSTPPAAPAYHPAFDRGAKIGPDQWDRAPPDGAINVVNDIVAIGAQNNHSCQ